MTETEGQNRCPIRNPARNGTNGYLKLALQMVSEIVSLGFLFISAQTFEDEPKSYDGENPQSGTHFPSSFAFFLAEKMDQISSTTAPTSIPGAIESTMTLNWSSHSAGTM